MSQRQPLVTVVVPAYNAAAFIAEAVESALGQTYPSLEVVVVDDGSRDNTSAVLERIRDSRLRVISTPNKGVSAARNTGWRGRYGKLVAFLDADDRWFPQKISKQVAFLCAHLDVGLLGTLMVYESSRGRPLGISGTALDASRVNEVRAGRLMPFPISSAMVRREVLAATGGFDEALARSVLGVEDLDFIARASRLAGLACLPELMGAYRIHPGSASARHFASHRIGTRFVRERLHARDAGSDLDWDTFRVRYSPSIQQRWGDLVQSTYRRAGLLAAEGRWLGAAAWGVAALILGPRYTVQRIVIQRPWRGVLERFKRTHGRGW